MGEQVHKQFHKLTNEEMNKTITQSSIKSTNQLIHQLIDQTIDPSINQSIRNLNNEGSCIEQSCMMEEFIVNTDKGQCRAENFARHHEPFAMVSHQL